jgi:tRNA nucleotidyltransferase (CCA-adding enzyme)
VRLYVVGGAVRDELLGLPASDRDWVAVGATPQEFLDLGYKPVGKDFPVFLDPATGEEVALARTERKVALGYHGFTFHAAPNVTLEEDLGRRDLTINAMARGADGVLVDPHGGQADLQARVLRHVSPAFVEDPVRLLRVARLAARFPDFSIAPETMTLLRHMVDQGEVDALVPERVWQELQRGLMAAEPPRMLAVLRDTGALARLAPTLDAASDDAAGAALRRCAARGEPLPVRWACLARALPDTSAAQALGGQWRVPSDCLQLAALLHRAHTSLHRVSTAEESVALFDLCDAWRRADRFAQLLRAQACWDDDEGPSSPGQRLPPLLTAAQRVDTALVAHAAQHQGLHGPQVGGAIHAARVSAVSAALALN